MFNLADFEPWWRFGFALLIGALIGLEREFYQQKQGTPDFAGIRTFSLITLLGSVTAFLVDDFGLILAALALGGLILMTTVSYSGALERTESEPGITTEVAAILTFLYGVLVMGEHATVAIALAVITSFLLALKGRLHGAIRNMSSEDIHVALQFALVAAVILPLLPDRAIDPFGLLNPFQIWLMVVFISGIGFTGYVLMNILGPSQGITLMGILGGLASSTATTISFSSASRENPHMGPHYARAVIMASTVMFPRVLFLVLVIYPPLVFEVIVPLATMTIVGLLFIFVFNKETQIDPSSSPPSFKIGNPLKLSTAIKFGLLFAFVLIFVEFSQTYLGSTGVYLTSFLTGLTDVDAITLSVTRLAANEKLLQQVAGISVFIASLMNTISKGAISYVSGSPELRKPVIKTFLFILFFGVISGVLSFILL